MNKNEKNQLKSSTHSIIYLPDYKSNHMDLNEKNIELRKYW